MITGRELNPCVILSSDPILWQVVAEQIPMLVQGVRGSQSQPDSPSAQLALIAASQNFLQVPVLPRACHASSGITAFLPCLSLLRHRGIFSTQAAEMLSVCSLLTTFFFWPNSLVGRW